MKNESLIIMVGGASSRMKRSLESTTLDESTKKIATAHHKSLIPVGKNNRPFLYYLIENAVNAGYKKIFLITSPENKAFHDLVNADYFSFDLSVRFAIQHIPHGREKPLGTADALQQCLDQYPELKEGYFTVCNGDNLYSVGALKDLKADRNAPNALISYGSSGFEFTDERILKFAVMDISSDGFLQGIIEKPESGEVEKYKDETNELRVSMNIFSFSGEQVYPFLENCPLDKVRSEKELPKAVANLIKELPKSMVCIPRSEHIPDLTAAGDIRLFKNLE
ncbi:sugar phosphate nucleotidyltransferase [Flagellimonas sp. 389]|uniref:sugar phosphate nucleotidyltransferase n=1 Tax=Flagellimonas sp. 389 TaxID=2835862 RepID=UPI002022C97A|nr:sugar phosphate nucleotidyltransferase [Flagellimonas sp. 389]